MSSMDHNFIFASLDSKQPSSTRKVHIKRLYDILQLFLQRGDYPRARRAWAILARCKEIQWMTLWATGLLLVGEKTDTPERKSMKTIEYLRTMMLQNSDERETVLQELIFCLILSGRHREAIDELDLYLPSFPYQDNPLLHIYAGMISLYLSQPLDSSAYDNILLRDACSHFEHAKSLDPTNVLIQAFLEKCHALGQVVQVGGHDSDDDNTVLDETNMRRKRART